MIVFDDMIADIISNKKLNSIVTELFIRCTKLNISLVFISQSYFKVYLYAKDPYEDKYQYLINNVINVRNNSTHFSYYEDPK